MASREQLEQFIIKTLLFSEESIQSAVDSKLLESDFKHEPYKKIFHVLQSIWSRKLSDVKLDTSKILEFASFNNIDLEESILVGLQDELPTSSTFRDLKKSISRLKFMRNI